MPRSDVLERTWTVQELEELTLELLANLLGRGLVVCALNSAVMVEVCRSILWTCLTSYKFRIRTGLRLPARDIRRDTLRSVQAFAQFAVGGTRD